MPDEKPMMPAAQAIPTASDLARAQAQEAPTQFTQNLLAKMAEKNTELKDVKAPETAPTRNYDKDADPSKMSVYDPKGMLPKDDTKEVPKAEPKPAAKSADDYPENAKSDEAKTSWQKLKADRDEKAKLFAERDAELLELKKRFDPSAYEKAIKENEELSNKIRRLDVEQHPKFKEAFEKPIDNAVALAKRAVPSNLHSDVEKILRQNDSPERDKAIADIVDQLPAHKATVFSQAVIQADTALESRKAALASEKQWVENFNREQKEANERARIQTDAQAKTVFQNVLKQKFGDNPLFDTSNEAVKESNAQRIARAESLLFGSNAPEALAEAVLWAEYGRDVQPLLVAAYAELERMTKLVDKQSGQSMGKTSGSSSGSNDNMSFADRVIAKTNEKMGR